MYSTASNPQVTYFSAEDDEVEEGDYVSGEKGDEKPSGDNL